MDEKDFELLTVLSQTKNITKTADLLYMTQSALSKRIYSLEEQLGTQLLIRSRRGIQFTPEGEQVLQHTQKAAKELQNMRSSIQLQQGNIGGTLHIGVNTSYLGYEMPDILADYHKQFPKVSISITNGRSRRIYQQLTEGLFDLAIVRGDYPYKGSKVLLSDEHLCLVCNQELQGIPLSQLTFIGNRPEVTFEGELARWLYENGIHISAEHIYSEEFSVGIELVKKGVGWSILPEFVLKDFHGYIEPLFHSNGKPFVRPSYLLYSGSAMELPQAAAFINLLISKTELKT